ncbi:MAG: hypothetical protein RR964_09945 [Lachnospiraceae bacterium]
MRRVLGLVITLTLVMMTFAGCSDKMGSLTALDENEVDKIVVTIAMGNPEYGADSKTITDKDEISSFIELLNNSHVGGSPSEDEIGIGGTSTYVFYKNDEIQKTLSFNVNDTKIVWFDKKWRDAVYAEGSLNPYELYEKSKGELVIVNDEGNEMDLIRYNGDTYIKSELPQDIVEWLENYNSLTYDEQLAISFSPDFGDIKPLGWVVEADISQTTTDEWPVNKYTDMISMPEGGTMKYYIDDSKNNRFSVFLTGLTADASSTYIQKLLSDGYSEIATDKNSVSAGTLLEKDNVMLSIAYSDDILAVSIVLE